MFAFLKASLAIAVVLSVAGSYAVQAALVIDDFNDAASVTTPAMLNDYVDTLGVGALNAKRSVRIAGLQASPAGQIEINAANNSSFVATLGRVNPQADANNPLVSVQLNYDFASQDPAASVDLTEAGANNAFVLELGRLTSAVTPRFFMAILQDERASYETVLPLPPLSDGPFSLYLPFDGFEGRGGGGGQPNFSAVRRLNFELRAVGGPAPAELDFQLEINRIRVSYVPEPVGLMLAVYGMAFVGRMRGSLQRAS